MTADADYGCSLFHNVVLAASYHLAPFRINSELIALFPFKKFKSKFQMNDDNVKTAANNVATRRMCTTFEYTD